MSQSRTTLEELSVVIPLGPGETAWKELLSDLKPLPQYAEVLLVGVDAPPSEFRCVKASLGCDVRWLESAPGRALQMNIGADNARRRYLWFLHADSRVDWVALDKLQKSIHQTPNAIHFFELKFQRDGPRMTGLNAWGANLRARLLRLPFGDQGFCLSKDLFNRLGRFDESVRYGEDHLMIWRAHRKRILIRPVAARIATSARKYAQEGWLRTTCVHLWLTARQAIPQLVHLLFAREAV